MSRSRYTNPVENMRSYVMVHGGIDRDERLRDVEWLEDVVNAAMEVSNSFSEEDQTKSIDKLKEALRA